MKASHRSDDADLDTGARRGIAWAVLFSIPLWLVILLVLWIVR